MVRHCKNIMLWHRVCCNTHRPVLRNRKNERNGRELEKNRWPWAGIYYIPRLYTSIPIIIVGTSAAGRLDDESKWNTCGEHWVTTWFDAHHSVHHLGRPSITPWLSSLLFCSLLSLDMIKTLWSTMLKMRNNPSRRYPSLWVRNTMNQRVAGWGICKSAVSITLTVSRASLGA